MTNNINSANDGAEKRREEFAERLIEIRDECAKHRAKIIEAAVLRYREYFRQLCDGKCQNSDICTK